jgi:hypothetical protein
MGDGALWVDPSNNHALYQVQSGNWIEIGNVAGAGGTVSSVDMSVPGALYSLSGNPITGAGTLALALKTQAAHTVLAGPTSGADATPTMRALVAGDVPAVNPSALTGSGTVPLAAVSGLTHAQLDAAAGLLAAQIASVNPSALTGSGTVPLAALSGLTTSQLSASAGIVAGQIASVNPSALTGSGTVPTAGIPNLAASKITSGQLAAAQGGTGLDGSTASNGALLIGNGSGYTLATLSAGSNVTITNASGAVTIASTASGAMTKLAEVVTSGTQASVSFSGLSGSYRTLALHVTGRSTAAGTTWVEMRAQFNGDTGNNYDDVYFYGIGGGPTGGSDHEADCRIGWFATTGAQVGTIEALIPLYAGTTFSKVGSARSYIYVANGGSNQMLMVNGFNWRSTAAITSILLYPGSGSFVDGTTCTLYGLS